MRIYLDKYQTKTVLKALKDIPQTEEVEKIVKLIEGCLELQKSYSKKGKSK